MDYELLGNANVELKSLASFKEILENNCFYSAGPNVPSNRLVVQNLLDEDIDKSLSAKEFQIFQKLSFAFHLLSGSLQSDNNESNKVLTAWSMKENLKKARPFLNARESKQINWLAERVHHRQVTFRQFLILMKHSAIFKKQESSGRVLSAEELSKALMQLDLVSFEKIGIIKSFQEQSRGWKVVNSSNIVLKLLLEDIQAENVQDNRTPETH